MFETIDKTQTSEKIVEEIINFISNGRLKPGQALPPERELATQLGVSRVALREAITSLAMLGIVEKCWGKGNFISENVNLSIVQKVTKRLIISKELEIFEVMEARLVLESEIAVLAALRRNEEDIQRILRALDKYLNTSRKSINRVDHDKELHFAIARAAKNAILESLQNAVMEKAFQVIRITTKIGIAYKDTEEEHKRIVDAIINGDPELARQEMTRHVLMATQRIFKSKKSLDMEVAERLNKLVEGLLRKVEEA
ncbi:FadR/GntR family transcriptional regulator [Fervidobacterium sp.]